MTVEWTFTRHQQGQPIVNPIGDELLNDSDDEWKPGEVLVRESIQNSLDAQHEDEAEVSVVFQVRGNGSLSRESADFWFSTLWPHLRSTDCKLPNTPEEPNTGAFVVVEDFGTHGLEGDTRQGGLGDSDNRFFNFFRAEGLSGNPRDGMKGGSWGIGKSVFNRCSSINSFLALTGRRREQDIALIGKSLLWHHRIPAGEFQGIGQFGARDQSNEFMVLPVTDDALVRRLIDDFRLTRPIDGTTPEPGLSVVIPYPDKDITAEGIVEIVIREYFQPIIAGRLRVRVSGLINGKESSIDLDQDSLQEHAVQLKRPELMHVLDLARWSLADGPSQSVTIKEPPAGTAPVWHDDLLPSEDPEFKDLCQRYDRGERVAIRVPLKVEENGKQPALSAFTVHLHRDLNGSGYRPVFVRGCIVVPNARKRVIRNQNMFCLVTIDDGPLAVMLRAAEPPSHTYWSPDTANFRGRYQHGKATIDFVVNSPKFLAEALSNTRTERDLDVWADLFPAPMPGGRRDAGGSRKKGKKRSLGPIQPPKSRPKPFRINEVPSGFAIVRDNAIATPLPALLEIVAAYDTSSGDPFTKYAPEDFQLRNLMQIAKDIEEKSCIDNRIVVKPKSDDFRIEFSGIDLNRDLAVRVRTIDDGTEGQS